MQNLSNDLTPERAGDIQQHAGEYLSFRLGAGEYGVAILKVQEIRGYETPTRMVGTPDYVKGVINLRGVIVPIVDLRVKFKMDEIAYTATTVVIVLNLGVKVIGVVVDAVSDVVAFSAAQLRPIPGVAASESYLLALGTQEDRMVVIMDIEKLLKKANAQLGQVNEIA